MGPPRGGAALSSRLRAFDQVVPLGSAGTVQLDETQQRKMRVATAQVAAAVREEPHVQAGATVHDIEGALFNR